MSDSFFTSVDNIWFSPTSHTRGPWDENACHAGPPTGLLARAVEHALPEQRLTRLAVNLLRPIPFSKIGLFPITKTLHDKPAFNGDGVDVRYPDGENHLPGPTTAWLKTVPLLNNEISSPFQSICPLADCGNAFGRNADPSEVTFMNTDLTLVLHRDPVGEWFGSQSAAYWEPNGIGLADALLFDSLGVVGRALQTLVLRKTS